MPQSGSLPPRSLRGKGWGWGAAAACAGIGPNALSPSPPIRPLYFSTTTPFQNATWPAMFFAASLGSG